MGAMEHLHDVFGALHEKDMQRQGLVCMLLNECFSFSLPPCHVLSEVQLTVYIQDVLYYY